MFKVFQFQLTEIEHEVVNSQGWDATPRTKAYLKKTFSPVDFDHYEHVANVDTDELESAFGLMNLWHKPELVTKLVETVYSLSVGDILEDENGVRHFVDTFGFKQL